MDTVVGSSKFSDHPKGLYYLFFAELWERFSYYGLHALIILYMTKELAFSDEQAISLFATYGALVYLMPILGGIISDQLLGKRKCIFAGGVLIAIGHFIHAVSHPMAFFVGLALIISGTGLFKANITSLVGDLYEANDKRRDAGFTLYYVGINIGSLLAPILCGYIGERVGWGYGFSLAGVGMMLGLVAFVKGADNFNGKGLPPGDMHRKPLIAQMNLEHLVYVVMLIAVPLLTLLLNQRALFMRLMPIVGVLALGYLLIKAWMSEQHERQALLTILTLMFFQMAFFALFHLSFSTLNLFTDRNVDRFIFGFHVPASQFLALNPIFIILLGPIFSSIWMKLSHQGKNPSPPLKFVLGLVKISLAFGVLMVGMRFANENAQTAIVWLVLANLLLTMGELCISPVGLSMVSKLAPPKIASLMMGIWMLSISFAELLSGLFAKLGAVSTENGQITDPSLSLTIYGQTFRTVMSFGLCSALILLLLTPFLVKVFRSHPQAMEANTEEPQQAPV